MLFTRNNQKYHLFNKFAPEKKGFCRFFVVYINNLISEHRKKLNFRF